jgi:hypothetical protein
MFTTYEITKYHKADIAESVDPEVEDLIAYCSRTETIHPR